MVCKSSPLTSSALENVTASNNYSTGAHLEGLDISIFSGVFNDNGSGSNKMTGKGLEVIGQGNASLDSVQANNNQLFGANVQVLGNASITNSFFSGNKAASTAYGLQVVSSGDLALNTVEASNNYRYGASLSGLDVAITSSFFNGNGSGQLNKGVGRGVDIQSAGTVSLNSIEANDNQIAGATITADGIVSITGSLFNGNQSYSMSGNDKKFSGYGLKVTTTGLVSVNDVTAEQNYLYGAYLIGTDTAVAFSSFSNNGTGEQADHIGRGLRIESSAGQVSLYQVTASNNGVFGANITANGIVNINNSVFNGNQSYTLDKCNCKIFDGYGLQVVTTSDIYLNNVTANENYVLGASLSGAYVEVLNSVFSMNSSNEDGNPTGKGLKVTSTGNTLLNAVQANQNQLFGTKINAQGTVTVLDSVFNGNVEYGADCKGTVGGGYGLKVISTGDILLGPDALGTSVEAQNNGASGVVLSTDANIQILGGDYSNNGVAQESSGLVHRQCQFCLPD